MQPAHDSLAEPNLAGALVSTMAVGRRPSPAAADRRCPCRRIAGLALLLVALGVAGLLGWGGDVLVAPDSLPAHAEVLVVLTGSATGEQARREEAVRLLRQGRADELVLSAPQVMYLGEWIPDLLRRYLERSMCPNRSRFGPRR